MKKTPIISLITALLLLIALTASVIASEIVVDNVIGSPETIEPGEKTELKITLKNIGNNDIENIALNLDFTDVPFAPLNSASEKIIDELKDGKKKEIAFDIIALPNAEIGVFKVPLTISYNENTTKTIISLTIASKPKLDVAIDKSEVYTAGNNGKITVKLVNRGFSDLKFVTITLKEALNYEILSNKQVYIGSIDADDFETLDFTIHLNEQNGFFPITIEYYSSDNKFYIEDKILQFNVYTQDEAKTLGLVKTRNYWWIYPIIILLLLFFFFRERKRRKKQ